MKKKVELKWIIGKFAIRKSNKVLLIGISALKWVTEWMISQGWMKKVFMWKPFWAKVEGASKTRVHTSDDAHTWSYFDLLQAFVYIESSVKLKI